MLFSFKYQNQTHYCCFAEETGAELEVIHLNGKNPTDRIYWEGGSSLNNNCQLQHCPIITLSFSVTEKIQALICSCPYFSKPSLCSQLCVGSQMTVS